ncbi:hypothetical protein [Streptomyces sp. NPDC095613]|uniref:hypothetical protein n=1 Tax=Streptomyces sp. NPDC095613 TaxID=3155540 RepID=UPI00331DB80E
MKVRHILTTAAAASALTLVMATQAVAADHTMKTDDSAPGGEIKFTKTGDIVAVCDIEKDGWAVIGRVYTYINSSTRGARIYSLQDGGADGSCKVGRANMGGKYNLAEGKTYWFEVCLHNSTEDKYCDWAAWKNDK